MQNVGHFFQTPISYSPVAVPPSSCVVAVSVFHLAASQPASTVAADGPSPPDHDPIYQTEDIS